jgi:cytochrome d ubiquinol oxidase subunit I
MEGQFQTERGAPLRIGGFPDVGAATTRYAIEIPRLGSFLAFEHFNAEVRGLTSFPATERPDPRLVHYPFQVMVAIGFTMLFVAAWFFAALWRTRAIAPGRALLLALVAVAPLGFVAIEAGWFVTEFGRQPWIIYHLMRTDQAATPREGIGYLLLLFFLIYVALSAGLVMLLLRWQPGIFAARRGEAAKDHYVS